MVFTVFSPVLITTVLTDFLKKAILFQGVLTANRVLHLDFLALDELAIKINTHAKILSSFIL